MSDTMTATPAAGWYPDPVSDQLLRWWDGMHWREETVPRPVSARAAQPTQVVPFADSRHAATASADAVEAEVLTITPTVIAPTAAPVAQDWSPARTQTGGAWALAFLPWMSEALVIAGALAFAAWGSMPFAAFIPVVMAAIVLLLSVAFVVRDRAALEELGHVRIASAWWILLGPLVYLIARTVRVRQNSGRGTAPLVALLLNAVAVTALNTAIVVVVVPELFGSI